MMVMGMPRKDDGMEIPLKIPVGRNIIVLFRIRNDIKHSRCHNIELYAQNKENGG